MNDPGYNELLKWSVENSDVSRNDPSVANNPPTKLDPTVLSRLFNGGGMVSDAQLMVESMDAIDSDDTKLEEKLVAFDNFEQLIEGLDNANNMEPLGLWSRLVKHLDNEEPELRMFAAWCCGIAVQNNIKSQERILVLDALPTLVRLATQDTDKTVRKKAVLALSSSVRNFQPGLDETLKHVPTEFKLAEKLDATDMDSVDSLINKLRENVA